MAIFFLGLCYKWGDWRHWEKYYSTILFYIIVSINESILTNKKHLWLFYGSASVDQICDYVFEFVIFPCVIILFLSHYPNQKMKQIFYVLAYTLILSSFEFIFYVRKEIKYYNGWNPWWSVLLYTVAFSLLILHYNNPLLAWLFTFILTCGVTLYFGISLMSLSKSTKGIFIGLNKV